MVVETVVGAAAEAVEEEEAAASTAAVAVVPDSPLHREAAGVTVPAVRR